MQLNLLKPLLNYKQLIAISCVGLILGIVCVWLPPDLLLIGAAGSVFIAVAWVWPEIALLGLLIITSTIYDINQFPKLSIGIGHLTTTDMIMSVFIGIIIIRALVESKSYFIHTPLDLPLLAFYATAMLSTAVAIYKSSISFNQSLQEVRFVTLYLTFFIVTNLIRDEKRLRRLLNGILLLAILVALAMVAQYIVGDAIIFIQGRVETLYTAESASEGVARILTAGQSLVLMGFITFFILSIIEKGKHSQMGRFLKIIIVGMAVLLTFNRNFWVVVGLASVLGFLFVSNQDRLRFIKIVSVVGILAVTISIPATTLMGDKAESLISGTVIRLVTIFDPNTQKEASLKFRDIETGYAVDQIARNPVIGIGLGGFYRPTDPRLDFDQYYFNDYIHNGHLYIILKTGLIGYFCFIWLLILSVKRSLQNWRRIPNLFFRGIMLSFILIMISISVAATVNPIYMQFYWTPLFGIMMGTNEVIIRLSLNQYLGSQTMEKMNLT